MEAAEWWQRMPLRQAGRAVHEEKGSTEASETNKAQTQDAVVEEVGRLAEAEAENEHLEQ